MKQTFFYLAGLAFLSLAKTKHVMKGYSTPKTFSLSDVDRCIEYDVAIADRFVANLAQYGKQTIVGKRILELGPGSDLGVGLLLVAKGASQYVAFDRHDLAGSVDASFYDQLAARVGVDVGALSDGRVTYVTREDFDCGAGVAAGFDIVFSNAAFEHFDDVEATIAGLTTVVAAGAHALIEVDLQTHSRWIREADPNNIYRYPLWLYNLFRYTGQPNRRRPGEYRDAFERYGWIDVSLYAANRLDDRFSAHGVHRDFRDKDMDWLSFILHAARPASSKA